MRRLVLTFAFLLIACPGNQRRQDLAQNSPAQTSTNASNPQANPEKSGQMNPIVPPSRDIPSSRAAAAANAEIQVQLTEYEIRMPDSLAAGRQIFHVANAGKLNHNFAIEGNGVSAKLQSDLTRGDWVTLAIDLKPGTYTFYCPVDQHRARGMQRTITVHQ